jgi:hypothetical protein
MSKKEVDLALIIRAHRAEERRKAQSHSMSLKPVRRKRLSLDSLVDALVEGGLVNEWHDSIDKKHLDWFNLQRPCFIIQ